ncbi:glycosyltransferase family 4 protein [Natronospora cellulosivora (SeqCode)]
MKAKVGILTSNFFDPEGQRLIYGGAERYGIELTKLLHKMDFQVEWWQVGSGWEKELLEGVKIKSIKISEYPYETMPLLNQAFQERAVDIDYAIYFVSFLAYPQVREKSISISHGIYWDYPLFDNKIGGESGRKEWFRRLKISLSGPEKIVSVDTAFIEWVKATWVGLDHKFRFIPNFVDLSLFNPENRKDILKQDPIRIIYPRRLTSVRGINETVRVAEILTYEYKNIEFHIVGRAHNDQLEKEMTKWASEHERVYYYWQPPERMSNIYKQMDIALIPTKAAEGTSLSCLEAMACGCAIISTYIGGLSDLIINNYNGILIEPGVKTLTKAIKSLIDYPEKARKISKRGIDVAASFSIDHWQQEWKNLINEVFT